MKLIIAGGRDYNLTASDYSKLESLHLKYNITEIVCGTPYDPSKNEPPVGADQCGAAWGYQSGIPVKDVPADWKNVARPGAVVRRRSDGTLYDAAAGPYRNKQMAEYVAADESEKGGVALFPGGRGTASMYEEARKADIWIFDFRETR